jgi:hypothetical protein
VTTGLRAGDPLRAVYMRRLGTTAATRSIAITLAFIAILGLGQLPLHDGPVLSTAGALSDESTSTPVTQVVATIPVATNPYWPVFDPFSGNVYVSCGVRLQQSDPVAIISGGTNTLVATAMVDA